MRLPAAWLAPLPCLLLSCQRLPPPAVSGALQTWHPVTLNVYAPHLDENFASPSPFLDFRLTVQFTHESGSPSYTVPGYFAADGNASETSATGGTVWRAHLCPDLPGRWDYSVSFLHGLGIAINNDVPAGPVRPAHGASGSFTVAPSDKSPPDFRARGRLQSTGRHFYQCAGDNSWFLKAGADSPETLLASADFDGTAAHSPAKAPLKTWEPHLPDWRPGDPSWQNGRGRGLIGALNYLASQGLNAVSFLTYNAGGDGDNVWPFPERDLKFSYDCSKLDQWRIVFEHAQSLGLLLHCKLQETENDGNTLKGPATVPESLDGGNLGPERRLYLRELTARFAHLNALQWNLGEENSQTPEQQRAMAAYLRSLDPYHHPIVLHTFPNQQEQVYTPLLGQASPLDGVSLQNNLQTNHANVLRWRTASAQAGKPWVTCNDEQGPATTGVPTDPGFGGSPGTPTPENATPATLDDIRHHVLWGTLIAGGAGVEYYFGYQFPENDLNCQNWRSRSQAWKDARTALQFFQQHNIPFQNMHPSDFLLPDATPDGGPWCLSLHDQIYLVYLPNGGTTTIDLSSADGTFQAHWFNPRQGGALLPASPPSLNAGQPRPLGPPPADPTLDWLLILRKQ